MSTPESPLPCEGQRLVHTIGHSNKEFEAFCSLLESHRIALLVDIRRWPSSRKFPHFNRDSLSSALKTRGIEYEWFEELGGYRRPTGYSPNSAWKVGSFRAYADFMLTENFRSVFGRLAAKAENTRAALMCAESLPWRCHRQILSDAFVVRGWTVRHIIGDRCEPHRLPDFAEVKGNDIYYRRQTTLFG